jgi:hypothetical protein
MTCRKKDYGIGDSVKVRNCWGGYRLPIGLPEGTSVRVVAREGDRDRVEFRGRPFSVSVACIESGWEYRVKGKWRDERDPLVSMELRNHTRRPQKTK